MKTTALLLAVLFSYSLAMLHADEPDCDHHDGVQVGRVYSRDEKGYMSGSTYIITTDRKDGCGLGIVTGDDGSSSTYLVTPEITVETSHDR